jgi:hypothetical protein
MMKGIAGIWRRGLFGDTNMGYVSIWHFKVCLSVIFTVLRES